MSSDPTTTDACILLSASDLEYFVGLRLSSKDIDSLVFILPNLREVNVRYPSKGSASRLTESLEAVALTHDSINIHVICSDISHGVKNQYKATGITVHNHPGITREHAVIPGEVFIQEGALDGDTIIDSTENQRCDHEYEALEFVETVLDISLDSP